MALRMSFSQPLTVPSRQNIVHQHSYPAHSLRYRTHSAKPISSKIFTCLLRASPPQKCTYPDPILEFAEAESQKFRTEILKKLSKDKEPFGNDLETVNEVIQIPLIVSFEGDWYMKFFCGKYNPGYDFLGGELSEFISLKPLAA